MTDDDKKCGQCEEALVREVHPMLERLMDILNHWQPSPAEVALAAAVLARYSILGRVPVNDGEAMLFTSVRNTHLVPYVRAPASAGAPPVFEMRNLREISAAVEPGPNAPTWVRKLVETALTALGPEPKIPMGTAPKPGVMN